MDTFWVGVAFFIFIGILVKFGVHKKILGALDSRGELVAQELAEARRLRQDAERLLAEYEAKRLAAEAEAKLNDFVTRRTKSAEDKIAQAEIQAAADVRAAAAEAATRAAETILRAQMAGQAGDAAFATGLQEVKAKLN
jgi:F-type H+-transporting ATPase subunit b